MGLFVAVQHIDGINLFGLISIASLLYCAPLAILMEGSAWSGAYNTALANVGKNELFKQMAIAGIFYHLYNQVSLLSNTWLECSHLDSCKQHVIIRLQNPHVNISDAQACILPDKLSGQ